jgi:hypothetical protein
MKITNKTIALVVGAFLGILTRMPLHATVINIPLPTPTYTGETNLFDAGPQNTTVTSLTNGTFTIGFSGATVIPRAAVPVGWQTWSAPPFSEGATPRIDEFQTPLGCTVCTVTLSLSSGVKTFGFEVESDPFPIAHTFAFTFFDGSTAVASEDIPFSPGGFADARLVAMTTPDEEFTSVTISGTTDFAIARFRYSDSALSTPEPASTCLFALALALFAIGRLLKVRESKWNHRL